MVFVTLLDQIGIEFIKHRQSVFPLRLQAKVMQYGGKQLVEREISINDESGMDGVLEVAH